MSNHGRRVVTGHDPEGNPIVVSDGPPPHAFFSSVDGPGVADVWSLAGPPETIDDGFEPEGGFPIEPPPGGAWWRLIRLPLPDQALPREEQFLDPHFGPGDGPRGMHATDTLDFAVILDGSIELETESDATVLGVGDCVVQRGTQHRWRVVGDGPCTYLVALFSPQADSPAAAPGVLTHASGDAGHRRVVVSTGEDGRSAISGDGGIPFAVPFPDGGGITDLWHTGWRLASADQGGDLHGPWELETGEAIVWRLVEFPAGPSQEPGFVHTTASIDLDVVLDGELDLALPGSPTTRLAAGDLVVQRGTAHAWTNPGTAPARLLAIMIGVPASATDG